MPIIQVNSSMREAFDNIKLKNVSKNARSLAQNVLSSLDRKVGLIRSNYWNAQLSLRTAKKLNAGVWDNPHARMAYDDMVRGE